MAPLQSGPTTRQVKGLIEGRLVHGTFLSPLPKITKQTWCKRRQGPCSKCPNATINSRYNSFVAEAILVLTGHYVGQCSAHLLPPLRGIAAGGYRIELL